MSDWAVAVHNTGFYEAFLPTRSGKGSAKPEFCHEGEEAFRGLGCALAYAEASLQAKLGDKDTLEKRLVDMIQSFERVFGGKVKDMNDIGGLCLTAWAGDCEGRWEQHFRARKLRPDLSNEAVEDYNKKNNISGKLFSLSNSASLPHLNKSVHYTPKRRLPI